MDNAALDDWLERSGKVLEEHERICDADYKVVEVPESELDFSENLDLRTYGLLDLQDFWEHNVQ